MPSVMLKHRIDFKMKKTTMFFALMVVIVNEIFNSEMRSYELNLLNSQD